VTLISLGVGVRLLNFRGGEVPAVQNASELIGFGIADTTDEATTESFCFTVVYFSGPMPC
jgi:hypothetical protein